MGWSLPFTRDCVPAEMVDAMAQAGIVERRADGLCRASVRVSSVRGSLFLHSAYPTTDMLSVFLGPEAIASPI